MKLKNILKLLLAAVMTLAVTFAVCSCEGTNGGGGEGGEGGEGNGTENSGNASDYYKVTVLDGFGDPINGIIVSLLDESGASVAKQVTGAAGEKVDGRADFISVKSGSYTISLQNTNPKVTYYYDTVTVDNNNTSVSVYAYDKVGSASVDIYGQIPDGMKAYSVGAGAFYVDKINGDTTDSDGNTVEGMTYFIFTAPGEGVYEIFFTADSAVTVGNYGSSSMFVLSYDIAEEDERISDSHIQVEVPPVAEGAEVTPFVIGVGSDIETDGVLIISRKGELPDEPQYQPYREILPEEAPEQYTLPAGYRITDFDITDMTLSVTLGDDGYYYTNDGRLVLLRLGTASPYLDPIAKIAGFIDGNVGMNFGGYVYDEDGNYSHKESYNTLIGEYYEASDATEKVYPLTEELAAAITLHGTHWEWFDSQKATYLFSNVEGTPNKNNLWLFACVILEK